MAAQTDTRKPKWTRSKLEAMTVTELKNTLLKHGLTISGSKPELINRILAGPPAIIPVSWSGRSTVYVVRHARQTEPGTLDPPIVPGQIPPEIDFNYIITSPYKRTRQTAALFNNKGVKIYVDPRISEYHAQKHRPGKYGKGTLLYGHIPGDHETWNEFTDRIEAFVSYLSNFPETKILVVTHGLVVKYIYDKYNNTPIYARGRNVPFMRGLVLTPLASQRLTVD